MAPIETRRPRRPAQSTEPSYMGVAARLRSLILSGEYQPGTWLRMQGIAKRFGVSVQPVREALQQLQGDGLVEFLPNRGARVRGLDRGRIVHIYEIREAIESFTARRFAEECSLSDIRILERIQADHDRAAEMRDRIELSRVNKLFHAVINGHGGNAEALALVTRYYALTGSLYLRRPIEDGYWDQVRSEHHALIKAFRDRDPVVAGEIGARHVRERRNELLASIGLRSASTDLGIAEEP